MMISRLQPLLLALVCAPVLLIGSLSYAGEPLLIDADRQYDYARHNFENAEYGRAVDEYKRFIYFFPDDVRIERARFQIGMAFFLNRQYPEAIAAFEGVIQTYENSSLATQSYYMISDGLIRLNQLDAAVITLHNLITRSDNVAVQDEAYYRLGWISTEAGAWNNARTYFSKISSQNRERFQLQRLAAELEQVDGIPRKNPALTGALSIFPGCGYLYVQRYQDALIAFLLNGAFIWASYEAFDNGNGALGALLSFVEIGFYAGSIYGSVASAHKYNRSKTEQFIESLKKNTKLGLSGDYTSKSFQISLRFTF